MSGAALGCWMVTYDRGLKRCGLSAGWERARRRPRARDVSAVKHHGAPVRSSTPPHPAPPRPTPPHHTPPHPTPPHHTAPRHSPASVLSQTGSCPPSGRGVHCACTSSGWREGGDSRSVLWGLASLKSDIGGAAAASVPTRRSGTSVPRRHATHPHRPSSAVHPPHTPPDRRTAAPGTARSGPELLETRQWMARLRRTTPR